MKKVLIQSKEQLDLVKEEIRVSSLFNHPNLLPLLDHAIIAVKVICSALFFLSVPRDAMSNWILICLLFVRFMKNMLNFTNVIMIAR